MQPVMHCNGLDGTTANPYGAWRDHRNDSIAIVVLR